MNFNKCNRCGGFFVLEGNVCPSCLQKDQMEMNVLQNFITENSNVSYNMDDLSAYTGITNQNLNRFLSKDQFSNVSNNIQTNNL